MHGDAAEHHRKADRARTVAGRRVGRDAGAIDRQPDRLDAGDVAHQAVGHEAGDALVARHAEQQVAGHRGAGEAVGGGDDDVAGLGGIERAEHREIVGRPAVAGDGDADQRRVVGEAAA